MQNRKFLCIAILFIILLSACGQKVHENISEQFYEDTKYVMDTLDNAWDENRELKSDEQKGIDSYVFKYEDREIAVGEDMTEEEERLFGMVTNMIGVFEVSSGLPGDKDTYNSFRGWAYEIIEKGHFID